MSAPIIIPWKGVSPKIAPDAFIAPGAVIIGDVEIGPQASIWFNCVLRGDVNFIRIGARTNIQDGTVIHVDSGGHPTVIGDDVLVGHKAMIHGSTLESGCFVGMSATLLDEVVVETQGMVAAGAFVTSGKRVQRGQLWAGMPAKYARDLKPQELARFPESIARYMALGQGYREQLGR